MRMLMLQRYAKQSAVPLGPDDLELLQRFLEAWCDENAVDLTDESAADVASALIDWYQFDLKDRNLLKSEPSDLPPKHSRIQRLLRRLDEV